MIAIGNDSYYIDVDALNDELNNDVSLEAGYIEDTRITTHKDDVGNVISTTIEENKTHKPKEVDGLKFEMYMNMIRTIMETPMEREDSALPFDLNNAPISFTIAFNTLLYKKILKSI